MEAEPEKFRFESVTGVERRVAWNERNRETLVKEDARGEGEEREGEKRSGLTTRGVV